MGSDFSKLMGYLAQGLEDHADRDGLTGIMRAIFMVRGGHAPGTVCPTTDITKEIPKHHLECRWPEDECECHLYEYYSRI